MDAKAWFHFLQDAVSHVIGAGTYLRKLMALSVEQPEYLEYSLLFLLTYAFTLRMPSEAIPVRAGKGDYRLTTNGEYVILKMARRKNKPEGSKLVRSCWCRESKTTCPVHVLGPRINACEKGDRLFPSKSCNCACAACW